MGIEHADPTSPRGRRWQPEAPGGEGVEITRVTLTEVDLPLRTPFRTAHGVQHSKGTILVSVTLASGACGWGECAALPEPRYTAEWLDGARDVIVRFLVPAIFAAGRINDPERLNEIFAAVRGNHMAKAAVEQAVLDAWLRQANIALSDWLGGVRSEVPCGLSMGMAATLEELEGQLDSFSGHRYRQLKLKIAPSTTAGLIKSVATTFSGWPLAVDANASFGLDEPGHMATLASLDDIGLTMIEQPLAPGDLMSHRRLQAMLATSICLDESIERPGDIELAAVVGAARVVNIKPGRLGGLLAARAAHDIAVSNGLSAWVGGMLSTGVGRAGDLALASLEGMNRPNEIGESKRYFHSDITEPFELQADGTMAVPRGPGIGVTPEVDSLASVTVGSLRLSPDG